MKIEIKDGKVVAYPETERDLQVLMSMKSVSNENNVCITCKRAFSTDLGLRIHKAVHSRKNGTWMTGGTASLDKSQLVRNKVRELTEEKGVKEVAKILELPTTTVNSIVNKTKTNTALRENLYKHCAANLSKLGLFVV